MIDPESMAQLRKELRERMVEDRKLLEELRAEVRSGLGDARRIMPRQTTAVSLVGTDGGNNRVEFDPFMAQLIRVVDSSNNEYCLEVVTPTSDLVALSKRHLEDGSAKTPLGKMMKPGYFVENQMGARNRHDTLPPTMSTLVIIAHVKDGADLARKPPLPAALIDFIQQHLHVLDVAHHGLVAAHGLPMLRGHRR